MSPPPSSPGRSRLAVVARFVAHWLALSVGLIPFVFVVAAVDVGYPWVVGGAALGLAAVAVDRRVAVRTTGALSLAAVTAFFAFLASTVRTFGEPSTAWTVVAATAAYGVAIVVVRVAPATRVRTVVDPETRERSRD